MVTNRVSRVREMDKEHIMRREQELELEARRRKGLFRRLSVLGFIAIALACIGSVTIYAQVSMLDEKKEEKVALEEKLEQLKAEEQQLHIDIEKFNDLEYIAEIARRDYFLTKPGETLFKLPESSSD